MSAADIEAAGIYTREIDLLTGAVFASPNAHQFRGDAYPRFQSLLRRAGFLTS
jgi:hypothetical protein